MSDLETLIAAREQENAMSWVKTAKVGDKVQCIHAGFHGFIASPLTEGQVYTIVGLDEKIAIGCDEKMGVHVGLTLQEATNPCDLANSFDCRRFRPVDPRSTDISWAHEILKSVSENQPVGEPA